VTGLGCDLWGIEYLPQGKQSILRVFIDSQDGIDIKDCERISRQLSSVLDVEDPLSGKYVLEVSSPGIDRRLFTLAQFEQYAGANVKINLRSPFEGRRKFSGQLCGIEAGNVVVRVNEDEYLLPFEGIDRASIIPDFK
jgi:ribosome maturation factor RimP